MERVLEHLNELKDHLFKVEQIATKQSGAWRSDDPQFDPVLQSLDGSRVGRVLCLMGDMGSWPIPRAGAFKTQIEIMLLRDNAASRATLDRILYELYQLETSHVWDLETDLWP